MYKNILIYLKISVLTVLIGRAYQYIFFSAPFKILLYFGEVFKPYIERKYQTTWHEFLSRASIDSTFNTIIDANGYFFFCTVFAVLFLNKVRLRFLQYPILISGVLLIFLASLYTIDKNYRWGQFFEYTIQFSIPFLLLALVRYGFHPKRWLLIFKIIIAFTFAGHGLYALGYYPVPGYFVDMTIRILGVSETFARQFLFVAGILDFVIVFGLFMPFKKIQQGVLIWATIWGFATALARIVGNFYPDFIGASLHQNAYQTLYRIPHGLIPLITLILLNKLSKQTE